MPGQRGNFNGTGDYNEVKFRLAELRTKHPEASLQPVDEKEPFKIVEVGGQTFIAYYAKCFRTPDDPTPGIGCAWEPFPGKTNFTRDSELQNAETSAWGRAIMAALAADASKGVASAEEVRNRQADRAETPAPRPVVAPSDERQENITQAKARVVEAGKRLHLVVETDGGKLDLSDLELRFAEEHDGLALRSAGLLQLQMFADGLERLAANGATR